MKKLCLALLLVLFPMLADAQTAGDYYFANYDIIDLDFLRTHYFEINNGRPIQFEGRFESMKWLEPFKYKERLNLIGFDVNQYNLLQFSIKEKNDLNFIFPVLMFHSQTGELKELNELVKGDRIIVYGRFYKLKNSDFGIEVDVIDKFTVDRIQNSVVTKDDTGGHDRTMLLDARVSPTPTPTGTPTPTPGPSVWQKLNNIVNPKETVTVTGTVTPEAQ